MSSIGFQRRVLNVGVCGLLEYVEVLRHTAGSIEGNSCSCLEEKL